MPSLVVRWVFLVVLVLGTFAHQSYAVDPGDEELLKQGLQSLATTSNRAAFTGFMSTFQIISPHPDKDLQAFIDRAKAGDADSFALIAWMVWRGSPGFRESRPAAKIALMRALNEGSAQAPYYIGRSFMEPQAAETDAERIDNWINGLMWLGVSAGMGERIAFDAATKAISESSKGNEQARQALTRAFNQGIEDGVKRKRRAQ